MLRLELPFLYNLVDVVIENYGEAYPDLIKNKDKIKDIIKKEEERFKLTLDRGYKLLEDLLAQKQNVTGKNAFKLYDTFGFPLELTVEIAKESDLKVDVIGFDAEMQVQKQRAKAATQKISLTDDLVYVEIENKLGSTEFVGYENNEIDAKIVASVEGDGFVDIILDKTPFYAECGGQVGDSGKLEGNTGGLAFSLEVLTTFKVNHLFVHRCIVQNGEFAIGETVSAKIDVKRREEIKIHHTNAHLLQAALIKVLGDEVKQAGSQVEENRPRFDFSFSRAMTKDEVLKAEKIINNWIEQKLEVNTKVMNIEEAQQTGATALFGEKYEDKVRVVSIGIQENVISKEFCAGTHAKNTGDLRLVKIISESAIAAGTRRIESISGTTALNYLNTKETELDKISAQFKAPYEEVVERVEKLQEENKSLQKELANVQHVLAKQKFSALADKAENIEGGKLFVQKLNAMDANTLKDGVEILGQKLGDSIIVAVSPKTDGTGATIITKVSDNFINKGIQAGKIVSEIAQKCGGKGGGRPQFAQGGLSDLNLIDKALKDLSFLQKK